MSFAISLVIQTNDCKAIGYVVGSAVEYANGCIICYTISEAKYIVIGYAIDSVIGYTIDYAIDYAIGHWAMTILCVMLFAL